MCTIKLKFLVIILPRKSSVHRKMKFLVIILPYKSIVHRKIETFSHHFSPYKQCAL